MRKIAVITGTRAEFGLLYWLIDALHKDPAVELQLLVTGMHLSPEFGNTYQAIEQSGFPITRKVEMLLSSDSSIAVSKSMGLAMISFSEVLADLSPDIAVVLGDRFEIFAASAAAMIARIPIAHIHGGEATEGLIDEPIRHSITKMAHLHFTAAEPYRKRVIQLGEHPDRVFNTGTPGLDNLQKLELLDLKAFERAIDFRLGARSALVTFHPVTLETGTAKQQFAELLKALRAQEGLRIIFTKPNADTDGRIIIDMIDDYVSTNPDTSCAFTSLGQLRYLSALQHVSIVVGNSSSGLSEVPSFKIPTINIGDRQRGRLRAGSVIDCLPTEASVSAAFQKAFSQEFQQGLPHVKNPYGEAGASARIAETLKTFPLDNLLKKSFYDL